MGAELVEGYLLIADVSGYTEFVTGTELEHNHEIVRELTEVLREHLAPPLEFVKVEGDAVLCFGRESMFEDTERILEVVELCYLAYHDRLFGMAQATTCECDACREMRTLDLKFVVHRGGFVLDDMGGRPDLSGPDVILVHRMLKNRVVEDGGPSAYALLSEPCLERLAGRDALAAHTEEYDGFGTVAGGVHDLAAAADRMRAARGERLDHDTADVVLSASFPARPSVVWQYFTQPLRTRWLQIETAVTFNVNDEGRMGPGSWSHCAHGALGDAVRQYLDWKPYEHISCRFRPEPDATLMPPAVETWEFAAEGDATRIEWFIRSEDRAPEAVAALKAAIGMLQALHGGNAAPFERVLAEDGLLPTPDR